MRKLLLGSVALFALSVGSPAVAADMPVKARPLPPPVYSWSGCYGGGFVGYGTARTKTTVTETFPAFSPFYGLPFNDDTHLSGALGGFDFGCQYQAGGWLIGVEVDGAATNKAGQRTSCRPSSPTMWTTPKRAGWPPPACGSASPGTSGCST